MSRIRVMTFVDYLTLQGGAERLACLIATHLDQSRFASTLCVSRWPPRGAAASDSSATEALRLIEASGIPLIGLRRRHKLGVAALGRLTREIRSRRIDLLHTHKFGPNVWGTLAGLAARVPVMVAHEHTWSYEGQPLRRALDRHLIGRSVDRFVAVSSEDQRRMVEVEHVPPEKTVCIPNGIVAAAPTPGRNMRSELGIDATAPVIGIVAVLRAQKAHRVLLEAAAQLRQERPSLQILIAGEGPEMSILKQLSSDLALTAHVRFLGNRTDVADLLTAFDVAVSCSDFEGSPLAVMEYMAAGLPIVATSVGGVPDLIDSGVHGLLVAPGDPDGLAVALRSLLSDRGMARTLGENAQSRQAAEFGFDTFVHRLESLYLDLLAKREESGSVAWARTSAQGS